MPTLCLCGIDTGIGKSMVTGLLARHLIEQGQQVITQKLVQTGCPERPEDILLHRRLMECGWLEEDEEELTCPYCFSFAGSPHLAARLADSKIDPARISRATRTLEQRFEWVLLEGAGGLLVPLQEELTLLDYLAAEGYPLVLVTSPRLGSINHTLLSLEILRARQLRLAGLVYNLFHEAPNEIIQDTLRLFSRALQQYGFPDTIVVLPAWPHHHRVDWQRLIAACA
ncbi:MAG TPA: dethiobiotin synthase [Desulfobulbaceae bacterium]|nr:dethiobiotin synthase [Desulfobulbaceae bacterium]